MKFLVFLGIVDELIFVVVKVVFAIGIRQRVFENVTKNLCFKIEVEKVDVHSVAHSEEIFASGFKFSQSANWMVRHCSCELQSQQRILFVCQKSMLISAFLSMLAGIIHLKHSAKLSLNRVVHIHALSLKPARIIWVIVRLVAIVARVGLIAIVVRVGLVVPVAGIELVASLVAIRLIASIVGIIIGTGIASKVSKTPLTGGSVIEITMTFGEVIAVGSELAGSLLHDYNNITLNSLIISAVA